jgi:hypothetical protein
MVNVHQGHDFSCSLKIIARFHNYRQMQGRSTTSSALLNVLRQVFEMQKQRGQPNLPSSIRNLNDG